VPVRSLQNWEIDRRRPKLEAIVALAKALGVSSDELILAVAKSPLRRANPRKVKSG
jgi:transcriptional regulator with XRE-family HTH domain